MPQVRNFRRKFAGGLVIGLSLSACNADGGTEPVAVLNQHDHHALAARSPIGGAGEALLKEVHSVSARFHSTEQAEKAGYAADPFCVEDPTLGGMGHHWLKMGNVDPVFDALNPEVILYAPDKHGKLKMVAVEYIVIDAGQAAPTFDGQPFDVGGTPVPAPHWSLHVWLGKTNPAGLFAPFNPDVDCP